MNIWLFQSSLCIIIYGKQFIYSPEVHVLVLLQEYPVPKIHRNKLALECTTSSWFGIFFSQLINKILELNFIRQKTRNNLSIVNGNWQINMKQQIKMIGTGNTCKPMAVSFQCMTKSTTNKNLKKYINNKCNFKWIFNSVNLQ